MEKLQYFYNNSKKHYVSRVTHNILSGTSNCTNAERFIYKMSTPTTCKTRSSTVYNLQTEHSSCPWSD